MIQKILLFLFLIVSFTSCDKERVPENIIPQSSSGSIVEPEIIEGEEIDWAEEINFTTCYSLNDSIENDIQEATDDIAVLEQVLDKYNYAKFIFEYCKSDDGKYIFSSGGKPWIFDKLGRYDSDLGILEFAELDGTLYDYIPGYNHHPRRNYGDSSLDEYLFTYRSENKIREGFGKKQGNTVPVDIYGESITGYAEGMGGLRYPMGMINSTDSVNYCKGGLTPNGINAVCFADISYSYDYLSNTIQERKVCTYYIDDDGGIQTLETCREFSYEDKQGYVLQKQYSGIKFFQNKDADVSIIELDLKYAGVDVGGLKKTEESKFYKKFFAHEYLETLSGPGMDKVAVVNGAFFLDATNDETGFSFPIKSEGQVLSTFMDNEIPKRTLIFREDNSVLIKDNYRREYLDDPENLEVLVAFDPAVTARREASIGRSYIGIENDSKVIFFIAENKTQEEMNNIISDYGISEDNIIMLDGGPSAQLSTLHNEETYYGDWKVPQFNILHIRHYY